MAKFRIVDKLVQQIPQTFLKTDKTEQTYGCPDCTDGCGIYFELGQGTTPKKFYIDNISNKLETEVTNFCEFLIEILHELDQKK